MKELDVSAGVNAQQKQQEASSVSDRVDQALEGADIVASHWDSVQPVVDGIVEAAQFVGDAAHAVGDAALSIISAIAD